MYTSVIIARKSLLSLLRSVDNKALILSYPILSYPIAKDNQLFPQSPVENWPHKSEFRKFWYSRNAAVGKTLTDRTTANYKYQL